MGGSLRSTTASTIYVPKGSFLVKAAVFRGPCKSTIKIMIDGTIVAPDYRSMGNSGYWILFIDVDKVAILVARLMQRELRTGLAGDLEKAAQ
ncbi:hypothetical protein CK203_051500 [Vitis vinifera]|uniref:Polygalacturonase n=1 Tax=Vitis vinifera TaxID=29760 RepID=A0A438GDB7_VITVI|nr:hypothetical protein CK203_051500 [Vitis vinifera]